IGVTVFESAASSSRTTRATKLRHTPKAWEVYRSESGALTGVRRGSGGRREQGQQGRLRAAAHPERSVRRGARTRGDVQPGAVRITRPGVGGMAVQALGPPRVEVAVG